uniref:WD repeat-containing protein CG11141 n=1 Tax=Cacopsylla melanoneura TaxID=428564 RepID=A0A8D8M3T9_9HEMI
MNTESKENTLALREWMSLTNLINQVPNKIRRGLVLQDVQFTCIDAADEFIAIGTNVGIVFWCNRITLKVTQFKPERGELGICCLKLVPSVDYMLAVGDKAGIISIFKIPKDLPKDLPEEFLKRFDNKTEIFTVRGIHKTQITALEWSLNGEKLFSGDSEGVVGFTQMDFYMNLTKSCQISDERYRIVQLSFHNAQLLTVASLYRCVILDKKQNWAVMQIGTKDRKTLAELGAVFNMRTNTSSSPPLIYTPRYGQRIWISDTSGVVQKTLLFKEPLSNPTNIPRIKLLATYEGPVNCSNFEFSTLAVLRDSLLVSHSSNILAVLNPDTSAVVGVLRSYTGIVSVAVSRDEVFMVEGSRGVRRLGFQQDQYVGKQRAAESDVIGETMLDLAIKLKDAATVIAPLLKDYKEAAPVTRLSSPEVDYDVGIADESEDLNKPSEGVVKDSGTDLNKPSDRVQEAVNVNKTCDIDKHKEIDPDNINDTVKDNKIDLSRTCDNVEVQENEPCDSVRNENKDCDKVKDNEKTSGIVIDELIDQNKTRDTEKDGKTDLTEACDSIETKENEMTPSRRDSEVTQTFPSELKDNAKADLSPTEQIKGKEKMVTLKDVASAPAKEIEKNVGISKETAGNSKEVAKEEVVKSRQTILKEIGSQEYGDLVYSSNRKVRKSGKGIPRKKVSSITSNGGGVELDSDTASNMSEVDSLSVMTLSQTSSNSEFEYARVETAHSTTATNEDLESQVAKMLSLEDVLVNPPPLKTAQLPPEEDHSQLKLNFVDYSLSNASSTSDLTGHSSASTQSTIPASEQPVVHMIEFGENVVLNFSNEHFGESDEPKLTSPNDNRSIKSDTNCVISDTKRVMSDTNCVMSDTKLDTGNTTSPNRDIVPQTHASTESQIDSTLQTTSETLNCSRYINTDHVDSAVDNIDNFGCKYAPKELPDDLHMDQQSPKKSLENGIFMKSSKSIETVMQNSAATVEKLFNESSMELNKHTIEIANSASKNEIGTTATNEETHSKHNAKDESIPFEHSNHKLNLTKESIVRIPCRSNPDGFEYHSNYDDNSDSEEKKHTSLDSVNMNLPDLLTSVESNTNNGANDLNGKTCAESDGSNSNKEHLRTNSDCDCRNEESIDKHKGYISTLDQGWQSCPTPYTCVWLGVSCHKIYCGGPRLSVYEADLRQSSLEWTVLSQKATSVMVSPDNRFLWRSNLGVVSSLLPSSGSEWKLCARDVDSFSLSQSEAWYTAQGKVYTQTLPFSSHTLVPCTGHTIVKVVSCECRVWVLSERGIILERDNVNADNPMGDSWSQVNTPSDVQISDISLTHSRLGWCVDRSNFIYFYLPFTGSTTPQVGDWLLTSPPLDRIPNTKEPSTLRGEWWQLLIDGNFSHDSLLHTASAQKPCIRSNRRSLWITHPLASVAYVNTSSVWGYKWTPLELCPGDTGCEPLPTPVGDLESPQQDSSSGLKWKRITAEGLFEDDGYLWLLSSEGKLFNYDPYRKALTAVPCPVVGTEEDCVVTIESSMNALWILTEKSQIYIRLGISTLNPTGVKWKKLPLEQFASENIKVGDLSCACDIVWVCSTRGSVYMTLIPPHEDREQIPAWIPAEGTALPGCSFSRIFVGPYANMVWALDNKNNIYVREGIYHEYQLGVNWLFVPGLQATHLTISQSGVWALSRDTVYQRVGVSPTNFIGAYWQRVPGRVSLLSSGLDDQLYGARNEVALRLRSVQASVRQEGGEEGQSGGGEWEII